MNPMKALQTSFLGWLALVLVQSVALAQEPSKGPASIDGVRGVKQEAVPSIKKVEPPTANPAAVNAAQGVKKVDGVNTINGVKAPAPNMVQPVQPPPPPPPPATVNAAQGVKKVDGVDTINGVKAPPPNAVQPVPPPPAGNAVSTIRAVQGVQGIVVPKQRNLEAALQIKEGGTPDPKGKAAAAALFGPAGKGPGPQQNGDGRAAFQEFEKRTTPGS